MMASVSVRAFAKVNFGLNVLAKNDDGKYSGYHCIESIFQTVDLYDQLEIGFCAGEGCTVSCDSMELPSDNTLARAFEAFCAQTGLRAGIRVLLRKGIPAGGGLGGGSSDAAALVRGLERLHKIRLTDGQRDFIAGRTGSDVFFFMRCSDSGCGCALVSGRGDVVRRIRGRNDLTLLMIFPGVHSSTKEAYGELDRMMSGGKKIISPEFSEYEFIYNKSPSEWTFINTFTPVITARYEGVRNAIGALKKTGCCYAEMSGSGATVYGVFTSKQQAEFAYNLLAETWCCKLVSTV